MGIQALVINELDEDLHDNGRSIGVQVSQPMPDLIRNMAELVSLMMMMMTALVMVMIMMTVTLIIWHWQ